jgi:hypothetical protein
MAYSLPLFECQLLSELLIFAFGVPSLTAKDTLAWS